MIISPSICVSDWEQMLSPFALMESVFESSSIVKQSFKQMHTLVDMLLKHMLETGVCFLDIYLDCECAF